ncbi:hypothetical protein FSP39_015510 [Pinctada imbricata]|uniref:Uncharacterized protein n=1 Tax=Pinctada imbricata TaxID=66713 RepID=A0AA88YB75_PINIB|nr:hypothetical protein FSP39_015510 [Pinctada imbricata]
MLHVTTEVGKVGRRERERRHYPDYFNNCTETQYKPRGRRYIPHGHGFYDNWTPHNQNIPIQYSEAGPDWKSRLKYIPDPENPKYPAAEIFENNWKAMRPFPYTYRRTDNEWLLDPGLTKVGLRCNFEGRHRATDTSHQELTHQMLFGRGRNAAFIDRRNGIPFASCGDKSYQAVEYSPGFHKRGSSLPLPQFGANFKKTTTDTFVPLQPLPAQRRDTFREMESRRQKEDEINVVRSLDTWSPAVPMSTLLQQEEAKNDKKHKDQH